MVDNDAAFMWETEALRDSPRRREQGAPQEAPTGQWVTLRDAHYETGIPVETLRKWARRKTVSSSMEETDFGTRRMIRLDEVIARSEHLGRPLAPVPEEQREQYAATDPVAPPPVADPPQPEPEPGPDPEPIPEPDPQPEPEAKTEPAQEATVGDAVAADPPEGTVLVPIAAWDKMLMQLGNLHEAGQQLAEAKERAAKAETEAKFLRERLRETRAASPTEAVPAPPVPPTMPANAAPSEPAASTAESPERMWRYIYRGWRQRRPNG